YPNEDFANTVEEIFGGRDDGSGSDRDGRDGARNAAKTTDSGGNGDASNTVKTTGSDWNTPPPLRSRRPYTIDSNTPPPLRSRKPFTNAPVISVSPKRTTTPGMTASTTHPTTTSATIVTTKAPDIDPNTSELTVGT
ncbi:hypothetical protein MTO96_036511, partial [Rhipicephalus appendiculatus]